MSRPPTLLGTPGPTRDGNADLRYPSKDDFLANWRPLPKKFRREYYDEEAAMYYGEDNYNDYNDYDPDDHAGVKALRDSFTRPTLISMPDNSLWLRKHMISCLT